MRGVSVNQESAIEDEPRYRHDAGDGLPGIEEAEFFADGFQVFEQIDASGRF